MASGPPPSRERRCCPRIRDQDTLPIESRRHGPVQSVAGQRLEDDSARRADNRNRAGAERWAPRCSLRRRPETWSDADSHGLENGAGRVELQESVRAGVCDPDVGAVVENARSGALKPVVTVVTVHGIVAPGVTIETEPGAPRSPSRCASRRRRYRTDCLRGCLRPSSRLLPAGSGLSGRDSPGPSAP